MKTERYDIPLPESVTIDHRLSKLDENYVNSGNSIGIAYVFEHQIPIERLKSTLPELLCEVPALAGRADFKAMDVTDESASVPLEHVTDAPGSASDYAALDTAVHNRTDFIIEPARKDILRGKAPLMCVKLTGFSAGGCVLGVTINHGLMDAKGVHLIMRRWSDIIMGRDSDPITMGRDIYNFKTSRPPDEWQTDIREAGMSPPLNHNTLTGKLLKFAMFTGLDKIRARGREMIHFAPDHIAKLKDNVRTESGLDWVSTHVAVSAHILRAIIPLQLSPKAQTLGIGNVINIRGRVDRKTRAVQDRYAGNALYIMITQLTPGRPIVSLSRGEIARALHQAFADMTEAHVERAMHNIVDSLEAGFGYPGLNLFKPIMAVNNQSKFDVYNVDFGMGRPLRVIPQDVGDHIMVFPATDGGMEIYIRDFASLKRQKKLLEPEWQARLKAA